MGVKPNPSVPRRQLGHALKELREASGKARDDAAQVLECSVSKILRIEHGYVGMRAAELLDLLDCYEVADDQRDDLRRLARDSRRRKPRTTYAKAMPEWFRRYVDLEESASEIRAYDGELIMGLLQTDEYGRALHRANPLTDPADLDPLIRMRVARQERIMSANPIRVWSIMSEAAIRRLVGGPDVMRAQLGHVLDLMALGHVTVQVIPFSAGAHASLGFNFILLRFAEDIGVDVVYLEDLISASYVDKPSDSQRQKYGLVFDRLCTQALTHRATRQLIETVWREL